MSSDRILEIAEHLAAADGEQDADLHRWAAARGIWEEIHENERTYRDLGEELKKSHVYVYRYAKCWEEIKDTYDSESSLPRFSAIYYSAEVHGENYRGKAKDGSEKDEAKAESDDKKADEPDPRETATGWIASADAALGKLSEHPAAWAFLTGDDLKTLRGLPGRARAVLKEIKTKASAGDR